MNSIAQLASERTSLSLFAPAPSTVSSVPLTRNLPLADPSPYSFEGTRHRKQASTVRNMRAALKKASWGTRRIFRSSPCSKQAFPVQKGHSVPKTPFWGTRCVFKGTRCAKTGFWGTGEIFGTENALLRYGPPMVRNETTGYDYCVAGSGWKMRPLPTTRCTPTP